MKKILASAVLMACCTMAAAKLPALDDAAKAKAAETAAKAGWQLKVDAYLLCKVQDRVAAHYRKAAAGAPVAGQAGMVPVAMTTAAAAPKVGVAPAAAGAVIPGASASATARVAVGPTAQPLVAAAPAVAGGTAAVAAGAPTPATCAEPGPFTYNPVAQTPLETSGAHSPAGTAVSPPSVNQPAAELAPARKP